MKRRVKTVTGSPHITSTLFVSKFSSFLIKKNYISASDSHKRTVMSVSMENQERDGDKKHKDDDMDKLIKQIINVVPAIIKTKILCSIFEPSLKMK